MPVASHQCYNETTLDEVLFEDLLCLGNGIMTTKEWVLGQLVGQRAEGETHLEG